MEWIGPVAESGAEIENNPYSRSAVRTPEMAKRKDSYFVNNSQNKECIPYVGIRDSDWLI